MDLSKIYRPITANPFRNNKMYTEISPCPALAPYICCYWGTSESISTSEYSQLKNDLVIPDTCMDIIINTNHTENYSSNIFSGIQDKFFISINESSISKISTFGIRFYAWAVIFFADDNMSNSLNSAIDIEAYFKNFKKELQERISETIDIHKKIEITEQILMKYINKNRENAVVMNAIYKIINTKGRASLKELCEYSCISDRQLQRLFKENIGTSPKKFEGLVRYQILWTDIVNNRINNMQDAVYEYGFSDQSHLINTFKKYHSLTHVNALKYAYKNK